VLIGASQLSQLQDNLGAADIQLSTQEAQDLDAASALAPVYPNWFMVDKQSAQALG
jgi:aryl-alcohol dehydrogenase-like predicted oxidoreductase